MLKYKDTPTDFGMFILNECFMGFFGFKLKEKSAYHQYKPYTNFNSVELYEFFQKYAVNSAE